ncbi:hypothetical protein [Ruminococcus flavefaciens]|uniref:Uncharacterized protein n=1 Tax=Ruminococcus flavefaciens TaxID=1265 RepID=A0A1M7GPB6_RUMFL|nr:hypothetical protein [Ruminococcus flavefaciens]SHM17737.1 hypothetical protein SAMN04487860_101402 [Ruminococcus flavefaciens]
MKEKNIFDILGNAEDDSMERLTDKCPEITDAQLEKILSMSEKKYEIKKKEMFGNRTEKDNNIKMTKNDVVEGVERVRRPAWLTPLYSVASLILVAGVVLGAMAFMRKDKPGKIDTGVINPAVTATTIKVSGTTHVSTDKNGSTITTTVTTTAIDGKAKTEVVTVEGGKAVNEEIKEFVGEWKYQVSASGYNTVDKGAKDNGIVVVHEDGTYTYTDINGNVETGTVKAGVEEFGGSSSRTVNFYKGSEFSFGGYYHEPDVISIGNGSASRLVRGTMYNDYGKPDYTEYQNTARNLVEKYYEMIPEFLFRFREYRNMNDTVTFKLKSLNSGEIEDVVFARISGNGLEFNSMDDIYAYKRTVMTESYYEAALYADYKYIDDSYNSGDYIDETGVLPSKAINSKGYIIYRGNLYVSTSPEQVGWIGHTAPTEPIIITDVTATSFRAYYPSIIGNYGSETHLSCDIFDFVLDPSCNDWRINSLTYDDYSVYQTKAAENS